ncbi:pancreatic triacylglycerol lipase-like isoform X3 [Leptidea sinapis]|uniref:pancreatic triacylglycerol lipase-like isoform X3 n=1 Tax=Leptidea sinapis TaxID=189913 RepID=UPI0021C25783|nr:pancreatic triacylglycerol lipase-like isoform X3 [Leptidea sinapis]
MEYILILCGVIIVNLKFGECQPFILTTDELENHISPDDLKDFLSFRGANQSSTTKSPISHDYAAFDETTSKLPVPDVVDCFGLGSLMKQLWFLNMRPGSSDNVNTHFYFSSRHQPERVQVYPGDQFGLEWVDFDPSRRTIMIVHGFMSHSNASWVNDMTKGFLKMEDLNIIAVDWSKGGNTWKYWRAVANTRRVGSDTTGFMRQLISATGANIKDFHFVGHSLGAHIAAYVSYHLGRVARVTGLDPAQPCFNNSTSVERLDKTDADFVDIIHTNGRLLEKIGFGLPDPVGDADFYPNGGMQQPGCVNDTTSIWAKLFPTTTNM